MFQYIAQSMLGMAPSIWDGLSSDSSSARQTVIVVRLVKLHTQIYNSSDWMDDPSVCPYLYTDKLSDELKNSCLIKMQLRPYF